MNRDKRFIVELEEDISSGNLMLPVPDEILSSLGWYEGTELEIELDGDELIIREIEK